MSQDLAWRLRSLRDRRGWTVADMAERTGIPKRTLDKYMLRSGASLPGHEALLALAKGLGISLDWLVFGTDFSSEGSDLLATVAATEVSQQYFETLLQHHEAGERPIFEGEEILGLSPEEWATDLGWRVGEKAREMAARGTTLQELLEWKAARQERQAELLQDRFDRRLTARRQDRTRNDV